MRSSGLLLESLLGGMGFIQPMGMGKRSPSSDTPLCPSSKALGGKKRPASVCGMIGPRTSRVGLVSMPCHIHPPKKMTKIFQRTSHIMPRNFCFKIRLLTMMTTMNFHIFKLNLRGSDQGVIRQGQW